MNKYLCIVVVLAAAFSAGAGESIQLDLSFDNPVVLAGERQSVYLKVGLTGIESADAARERLPVNVAIVMDRSGSMSGEKIRQAREAAKLAVDMLDDRDIVSIITYSDIVQTIVPATRVSDRRWIYRMIDRIGAAGNTALFAGVSAGADEVRKFQDGGYVNRVILLSDGIANVGPQSPGALGNLGSSLRREGISVTTIGLGNGYNEDLMYELAMRSDGNHAFVEQYSDLARIFEYEFNDVLSVVAQDVNVQVRCRENIRPVRVLGRDAEIFDGIVYSSLNQIYGNQEKYILVELELPPGTEGMSLDVADVLVQYGDLRNNDSGEIGDTALVDFSGNLSVVEENVDKDTRADVVLQVATEENKRAVDLRDKGDITGAEEVLESNIEYLQENAAALGDDALFEYSLENEESLDALDDEVEWSSERKKMRDSQFSNETQQSY